MKNKKLERLSFLKFETDRNLQSRVLGGQDEYSFEYWHTQINNERSVMDKKVWDVCIY